jgi:hypothetical protein
VVGRLHVRDDVPLIEGRDIYIFAHTLHGGKGSPPNTRSATNRVDHTALGGL